MDHVAVSPQELAKAQAAEPAQTAIVQLQVDVNDWKAIDVATDLRQELGIGEPLGSEGPVTTHLIGQGALWAGLQDVSKADLATAETFGFPIVALILLTVFGSLGRGDAAARPRPRLGAHHRRAHLFLSRSMEMSIFTTNMASMIGIGVAVDYSLFVLARYREEIAAGREPDEARGVALATSGIAVVFSGLTVIASLAGLLLIDTTALRSMAIGAMLVVAVSVLTASTLLPALISLFGRRAYEPGRVLGRLAAATRAPAEARFDRAPREPFWERWTARVMRRPVVAIVAAGSVLLALGIPALSMKTADGALDQFPRDHETRVGFEAAAALGGPGAGAPITVMARAREGAASTPANAAAVRVVRETLASDRGVVSVAPPVASTDGRAVLISAIPRFDGESPQAQALVQRIRDVLPATTAAQRLQLDVGGSTGALKDFNQKVSGSMWLIVFFVLALSYVVLLVLLRSAILPLKAVLMNLLSVSAAYGVIVAVFQWGWVDGLFGFQSLGHIDTITPPLVLAVVFGLSMDYEVFLLSRIKERFGAGADTRSAVAGGLASSARTITSAALIMCAVFATFVATGVPSIQQIGLGTAVAIAVDATIVRLVLVPAAMAVMGRWNWWLPRPLERVLPRSDFDRLPAAATATAALATGAAAAAPASRSS